MNLQTQSTSIPYVLPLYDLTRTDVGCVGAKAANLGELARAGFPVPDGFAITTQAFDSFISANALNETQSPEKVAKADLPPEVQDALRRASTKLNGAPLAVLIQLLLIGGVWEEPGWTGYAFPRLREHFAHYKRPSLDASLVLGFLRGIWHLPLFLYGTLPWYDIFVFVPAIRIIFSWLYNKTDGSVPVIMLTHYASNVLTGSTMLHVFTGVARTAYYMLFVICACVMTLWIVWKSQFKLGGRHESQFA
jgi:hypothetical protein